MKYLLVPILLLGTFFNALHAQQLDAFEDVRNFFYIFDGGQIKQMEPQKVEDYKVARNYVVWINTQKQFKVYENGYEKVLREVPPTNYGISDNLMVFEMNGMLYAYENRRSKRVATFVGNYAFSDSIIAYLDFNNGLNVYYKGYSRNLEVFDVSGMKVGKNLVAYLDPAEQFYVFHAGENRELDYLLPQSFKVGRNTVAYVDNYNRFKIYHKGNIVQADPFAPRSYAVGDDMVAWVNRNNQFFVFDDGIIQMLEDVVPTEYTVNDAIIAYNLPNQHFKAYYRGLQFDLESYIPEKFAIDNETLVWVDYMNNLKGIQRGEEIKPADRLVTDFDVTLDVVRSDVNMNRPQFYFDGKAY